MGLVLVAVAVWWLLSGNGPQGPGGNDPLFAVPDVDASSTATPGDAPAAEPVTSDGVLIDSYVVRDALRLDLNYRLDADCPATLETPRVVENNATVTITLRHGGAGARCDGEGPVERTSVLVLLDSPLDGRAVLDGSTSPLVRVEPTASSYD
jgi:hypothetical protein